MSDFKTFITLLLSSFMGLTACTSALDSLPSGLTSETEASLRLDLSTEELSLSPELLHNSLSLRLFLVGEQGQICINQYYTAKDLRNKTTPILLENLSRGSYAIYVLVNEAALGLNTLDNIQNQADLELLQASSSQLDLQKGLPLVGVNREVLLSAAHQHISLTLKRMFAQLELQLTWEQEEQPELEAASLHGVYTSSSKLFDSAVSATDASEQKLELTNKKADQPSKHKQVFHFYSPELVGSKEGIRLSLTTAQEGQLKPLLLRRKNGEALSSIKRNSLLRIQARIEANKLIPLKLELVDWDKQEIDIPVFS